MTLHPRTVLFLLVLQLLRLRTWFGIIGNEAFDPYLVFTLKMPRVHVERSMVSGTRISRISSVLMVQRTRSTVRTQFRGDERISPRVVNESERTNSSRGKTLASILDLNVNCEDECVDTVYICVAHPIYVVPE